MYKQTPAAIKAREWRAKNLERNRELQRRWRLKNRDHCCALSRKSYEKHKARRRKHKREAYKRNPEKYRAARRRSNRNNKIQINEQLKARLKNNPNCRLRLYLSNRIRREMKKVSESKSASTVALLGCSVKDLWIYLESKFKEGMTRENYGKVWHVDHIMPCAIFDLTKPEHQKRCFHFSNLQPLFVKENQRKGAKILTNQFSLL